MNLKMVKVRYLLLVGVVSSAQGVVAEKSTHMESKCKQVVSTKKHELVNVRDYCGDGVVVDLCFYTTKNFMNKKFYSHNEPFLHQDAAVALAKAVKAAQKYGYKLFISDAYRPMPVQRELWQALPDELYVANPEKGGFHTRGIAVDVTLVDKDGNQLAMPSEIDDMTEKAHRKNYDKLPQNIRENILLLEKIMDEAGFEPFAFEWWHYNLKGWKNYPPLTTTFDELVAA